MRDINKKFSVRYYLNLVLMDTEDRRYFKQQEITLWRKADKIRKNLQSPVMAGTQNFQSEQQLQNSEIEVQKESFTKEKSEEKLGSEGEGSENKQIENMTREAGDGQQNDQTNEENAE